MTGVWGSEVAWEACQIERLRPDSRWDDNDDNDDDDDDGDGDDDEVTRK